MSMSVFTVERRYFTTVSYTHLDVYKRQTVFCVLILISLIIYCFKFISKVGAPKKETAKTEATKAPAVETVNENLTDDLELVAVISAAIAASEGTSTDSFVVRSIHRR